MKKIFTGFLFLCIAVTGLFIALISISDRPKTYTRTPRQYSGITAVPTDTIFTPGRVSIITVYDSLVYFLDQAAGIVYRTASGRTVTDTVCETGSYLTDIPATLQIDSTGIYCFVANQRKIFRFPHEGGAPDSLSSRNMTFSRSVRLTDSTYFVHYYDTVQHKAQFCLADFRNEGEIISTLYEFPHFMDGGLASDGQILTVQGGLPLIYFQYHNSDVHIWQRNEFRTFRTIDQTPAENTIIHTDGNYNLSSKTQFINLDAAFDGRYLYVLSRAISSNQPTLTPEIDIYQVTDGKYIGSVKLPALGKYGIRHIAAGNGILYTAHTHNIIAYKLTFL